ncbi:MAG: hypothetical protein OEW75_15945, partial [Cyclobacteriaceae bacterium]|nr:hypothetical protein [Cyclobacteriaceae bacterium]
SLVLLAFYFYLEQPLYALGALFVSLLHFLMMYFSLLTKNVRSIVVSILFSILFIVYLLYAVHLIQVL